MNVPSIRSRSPSPKGHKVHFPEEDEDKFSDHSNITVQKIGENKYAIHLGFLKLLHYYEIKFPLHPTFGGFQLTQNPPNVFAKVLEIQPSEDGYEFKIELFAHKEKLLKEIVKVKAIDDIEKDFTIVLNARVLGKGKGTPSLKTGIRCIGCKMDDDSEASDWQGFE